MQLTVAYTVLLLSATDSSASTPRPVRHTCAGVPTIRDRRPGSHMTAHSATVSRREGYRLTPYRQVAPGNWNLRDDWQIGPYQRRHAHRP